MPSKKSSMTTKDTVTKVLSQAKESLKVLEALEKEALAQIKNFKIPSAAERKRLTNETILASLKKIGVATQTEVDELRSRIESLEAQIATGKTQSSRMENPTQPTA